MGTIDSSLWTLEMDASDYIPPEGSLFIHGTSTEDRSNRSKDFFDKCSQNDVETMMLSPSGDEEIIFVSETLKRDFWIYDKEKITAFFEDLEYSVIVLDVTGLAHGVWAPILACLIASNHLVHLVYIEPEKYSREENSKFYNLSEKIGGISPLPGFERFLPANRPVAPFVALVGFEGPRLSHIMEQIETDRSLVYSIIGLPGFRPDFHFQTYLANRSILDPSLDKLRFAKANCPFEAFNILDKIYEQHDYAPICIAPIGTKPHGIGAVLFALAHGDNIELIYDHPHRAAKRSIGEGKLCLYDISSFIASSDYFDVRSYD